MFDRKIKLNQGLTLIELMVIIALISITLLVAVPSFSGFFAKQKLRGLGGELFFLSKLARAEAAKQGSETYIVFNGSGTSWCVGLSEDQADCDCTTANSCAVDDIERVISSSDFKDVSFDSNTFPDGKITISPYKGRSSFDGIATFSITVDGVSKNLSLERSIMGRDRICSPSGNSLRYPAC